MDEQMQSGLYVGEAQIPLKGVKIEGEVTGTCAELTVTQRYENQEQVDVEAVYVFPLEEGAAVCRFSARVGDREIEGVVEEKEEAFARYDDAMAEGHGAFLLDQERPNIFTVSVGNLKAGEAVEIAISYVTLLHEEGEALRLMLPTTVSPRYVPAGPPEVGQPDAERINPETRAEVPYGFSLALDIVTPSPLKVVESPSHPIRLSLEEKHALVTLSQEEAALDRDFVLLIETQEPHQPASFVACEEDGARVAMVSFYPEPDGMPIKPSALTFLLDCSGSMGGESIQQARRALALCVRTLAEDDTFNIVCFGSGYRSLWERPKPFSQETLDEATAYIEKVDADMGGTELMQPLQAILQQEPDARRQRQLILLTDGQVGNEDEVIALCAGHKATTRLFSFGIGYGASEHLVRGVARASGGAAEFIYPGERIEPKVLRTFSRLHAPRFDDVSVDWGDLEVVQAPAACPSIFGGDRLTVFARIKDGSGDKVTLRADNQAWELPLDLEEARQVRAIPTLWARLRIRELEEGKIVRRGSNQRRGDPEARRSKEIITLGKRYGLLSTYTSYVAIERRAEADKSTEQAVLRRVPIALTTGRKKPQARMPAPQMQMMGMAGMGAFNSFAAGPYSAPASPPPPAMRPAPMGGRPAPPPSIPPVPSWIPTPPENTAEAESSAPGGGGEGFAGMGMSAPFGGLGYSGGEEHNRRSGAPAKPKPQKRKKKEVDAKQKQAHRPMDREEAKEAPEARRPAGAMLQREAAPRIDALAEQATPDLFALLMTQRADGSFLLSAPLRVWLGDRAEAVAQRAQTDGEALIATAVVLALLAREAAERADEWKPAARKARQWLAKQPHSVEIDALL